MNIKSTLRFATIALVGMVSTATHAETSLIVEGTKRDLTVAKLEIPLPKDKHIPFEFKSSTGVPVVTEIVDGEEHWGTFESGINGKVMILDRSGDTIKLQLTAEWQDVAKINNINGLSVPEINQLHVDQIVTLTINERDDIYLVANNSEDAPTLRVFLSDPTYPQ